MNVRSTTLKCSKSYNPVVLCMGIRCVNRSAESGILSCQVFLCDPTGTSTEASNGYWYFMGN